MDGTIHFISAGPGDPEFLSLKGRQIAIVRDAGVNCAVVPGVSSVLRPRCADFVTCLYNPRSIQRSTRIERARDIFPQKINFLCMQSK